jgi:adenylate cyclase class 2
VDLKCIEPKKKKRHSFEKGKIKVEFDTWPKVPTYVEIEAESEEILKKVSVELGLNWSDVEFLNAGNLIQKYYGMDCSKMRYYTFNKIEYYENK